AACVVRGLSYRTKKLTINCLRVFTFYLPAFRVAANHVVKPEVRDYPCIQTGSKKIKINNSQRKKARFQHAKAFGRRTVFNENSRKLGILKTYAGFINRCLD
ncbi:MAG: hypothetical protein ACI9UU_003006, partial [Candidatus Azotimanducaceae bacterium]